MRYLFAALAGALVMGFFAMPWAWDSGFEQGLQHAPVLAHNLNLENPR